MATVVGQVLIMAVLPAVVVPDAVVVLAAGSVVNFAVTTAA